MIGDLIKKHRKEKGWSRRKLGEKVYRSAKAIECYENNRCAVSDETLCLMAKEMDANDLMIETNMFPILNTREYSTATEYVKLTEEVEEFINGWKVGEDNLIEEFYDVIQIMVNILHRKGITEDKIKDGMKKHKIKILNRDWDIDKWI